MATFLTTTNTSAQIENLITQAHAKLTLITPYLQINSLLLERLKDADRRGVQIHLVYGKDELKADEREKLVGLKRLRLYFLPNLHAKCYANEQHVIIGSMNLYEFSEKNNREMSILLSAEDGRAITDAQAEIDSIIAAARPENGFGAMLSAFASKFTGAAAAEKAPPPRPVVKAAVKGTCIRCSTRIRYQPTAPLCDTCYASWAAWGNEDYPERNCHRCGNSADVTKARPLCPSCFRADPFTRAFR